jgi:EAL domain-containing protein (putative c-di-GMP-specific phosphodiesterase class I)/GGDEF domain-containing protein
MARLSTTERELLHLCGAERPLAPSIPRALDVLRQLLLTPRHRKERRDALTGLSTREHLLDSFLTDHITGPKNTFLAVIRVVDYSRLAAFDPDRATEIFAVSAARLASAVGPHHFLCRVDQDCFAIWFQTGDEQSASREIRALLYVVQQDIPTAAGPLTPTLEVSSVIATGEHHSAEQVLAQAMATLGRATTASSETIGPAQFIKEEDVREQYLIEQDLERAITDNQLRLVFQPVVDLSAGRLVGAEALLRWTHPTLGAISPARFIPVVEELGLSDRYGVWVLDAACRQVRHWRERGLIDFKVAVNLSARQLLDDALPVKIGRMLKLHGLPPGVLELELTETAAMADIARTGLLFSALHELGISIAIDDFGSGYSSLSYLKNLRFDKLKIDREFVSNVDACSESRAICRALIELGRGLHLSVLAEGVETAEEVETLRGLGCSLFQGFFFSRPLEREALFNFANDPDQRRLLASPVHHHIHELERRLSA